MAPPPNNYYEALRPRLLSRLSQASGKHSFLSHSSSFEADDEASSIISLDIPGRMSPPMPSGSGSSDGDGDSGSDTSANDRLRGLSPPRYPGDDTRPTSSKELSGWYAYAFAAEVYVICGR